MPILTRSLQRMSSLCCNTILNKIWSGAAYGVRAYIYQESGVADIELSTPQCLLLALLHSLVTGDIMSCCLLADLCHRVQQLQSDYLSVWLTGDFVFPCQDMKKAMTLLSKLLETGVLKLPSHVTRIMSSLAAKYGIHGTQLVSPSLEGRGDLASLLEEAVLNNRPSRDIIAIASEGGDVNGLTQSGESLIHLATRLGNCSSIVALGFLKANLEVLNSTNATPLEEAVKNNCACSVKALLSVGAKYDTRFFRGDTYLHIAAAGGHNGALEVLLKEEIDVNKKNHFNETAIFQAVRTVNFQGVEMLLEKGADTGIVPEGSKSLLELAVESQNVEMFKALVKVGMKFNSEDGDTVFHLLARLGNSEMLKVAKEMGMPANIKNKNGLMPLHVASDVFSLKTFIGMGLDVNDRTGKGEIALHLSSASGSLDLVKTLWQEGAAVDLQDNEGTSALMIAIKNLKEDIAIFLLHKGADPNIKDIKGQTALHYAAEGGCIGLVTPLLNAGARVDEQDNEGKNPAFVAVVNNKPAVVQLLVENGANLVLKDHNGDAILHHAARSGYVEIVKVLWMLGQQLIWKVRTSGLPYIVQQREDTLRQSKCYGCWGSS
ncbi:putative ankyrin repeat protein RF_0381 [Halyomorpha halys]|uniref:putative ankyrin repeat protein RF_0381 n=1 Tax=Halyomorpha halys TaxID=286706 RepID=UPI0006D4F479|nr:uncharacterized protein LOC106684371 [Halyomorpha halys]